MKTKLLLLAGTMLPAFALAAPGFAAPRLTDAPIVVAQDEGGHGKRDRDGGGGGDRGGDRGGGRPEKAERPDKPDRPAKAERPDKPDRPSRDEMRSGGGDDRGGKPDRMAPERAAPDRPAKAERPDKPDRPSRDDVKSGAGDDRGKPEIKQDRLSNPAGNERLPDAKDRIQNVPSRDKTPPGAGDRDKDRLKDLRDNKSDSDKSGPNAPDRDKDRLKDLRKDDNGAKTGPDSPDRDKDRLKDLRKDDGNKDLRDKTDPNAPDRDKDRLKDLRKDDKTGPDSPDRDKDRLKDLRKDNDNKDLRDKMDPNAPDRDKDRLKDQRNDDKDLRDRNRDDARDRNDQDRDKDRLGKDRDDDRARDRDNKDRDENGRDRTDNRRDRDKLDFSRDKDRKPAYSDRKFDERDSRDRFDRRLQEDRRDARDDRDRRDERIDYLRDQRRERRDGDRIYIDEPGGRTIITEGGRSYIRRDENERFRAQYDPRYFHETRDGGYTKTVIDRPDGSQIVTVTDEDGRLVSRTRRYNGEDYLLIDNRPRGGGRAGVFVDLGLAPPRVSIPREEYVVDADDASYDQIETAFRAPPVEKLERSYSLDEIRQNAPLRERVRSVDIDSVTFDTGSWDVPDDQIKKLENVGLAMEAAIKKDPKTVFMVEGYTDAVGEPNDNLSLSDRRAESVAKILTKYFDIPAENLTTQGYGEQYLKVKTDGPEVRNRRVTVRNITPLLTSEK